MVNSFYPSNENHHSQVAPGCGTMKRNRNPKLFKSDNNINTACNGSSSIINNGNGYKNCYSPLLGGATRTPSLSSSTTTATEVAAATLSSTSTAMHNNEDSYCSSSNHLLLNDYADQFGSKLPTKQHLYVKAKDGTWSTVSSDAYQYTANKNGSTTNCSENNSTNITDTTNNSGSGGGNGIDDENSRLVSSSKSNINSINCSSGSQKYLTSFGKSDIV